MPLIYRSPTGGPIITDGWRRGAASVPAHDLFVSLVVFTYDHHHDLPAITVAGYQMRRVWRKQAGALHLRQWVQPMRRLMGALTVWETEDALHAFLDGPPHRAVVQEFGDRVRGDHQHWKTSSFDAGQTWVDAQQLIAASTPRPPQPKTP